MWTGSSWGDEPDAAPQPLIGGIQVSATEQNPSGVGWTAAGQGVQKGALAAAAWPDHCGHRPRGQCEADLSENGQTAADRHRQRVGLQREPMGHVLLESSTAQDELGLAHLHEVALHHRAVGDALAVDEGAVVAFQVDDADARTVHDQSGVVTRDEWVGNGDVAVGGSPDQQFALGDVDDLALAADVAGEPRLVEPGRRRLVVRGLWGARPGRKPRSNVLARGGRGLDSAGGPTVLRWRVVGAGGGRWRPRASVGRTMRGRLLVPAVGGGRRTLGSIPTRRAAVGYVEVEAGRRIGRAEPHLGPTGWERHRLATVVAIVETVRAAHVPKRPTADRVVVDHGVAARDLGVVDGDRLGGLPADRVTV